MPISSRFVISATFVLLATGFLTLVGIVVSTAWLSEKSQSYFEESERLRTLRTAAVELRSALQLAESSQRGYLVGGNEIYLAPYDTARSNAQARIDQLRGLLASAAQEQPMMARLATLVSDKLAEMDRSISLKTSLQDSQAAAAFQSNRGKALMDEASLFLSSIIRKADDRLTKVLDDQRLNAVWLRLTTIIGGLLIVLVVAAAVLTVSRYAIEVSRARSQLNALNATLEDRVATRTAQLAAARDRAELLVAEINHRVANSLSLVASLVRLQSNDPANAASRNALKETESRILAVASVHRQLYSAEDAKYVDLQDYLSSVLDNIDASLRSQGHGAALTYDIEPLKLKTDSSINLGVILNEWVTNAAKYAYPDAAGEIRVRLKRLAADRAVLSVEDDGVGRAAGAAKGTGLGTRIVAAMAQSIGGQVEYVAGGGGTVARLAFAPATEDA